MAVPAAAPPPPVEIRDVWRHNLEDEFQIIRGYIHDYPFVAFDTEFPGVVAVPTGAFRSKEEFYYTQVASNVNMLKIIQVGFCIMNERGELPPKGEIWQFNFHFSTNSDVFAVESLELLKRSGINFNRHETQGIHVEDFGALLTNSGMVCSSSVTWLTFHSCFDFAYLIRTIILTHLPESEEDFFKMHKLLFPCSYDIKFIMKHPAIQAAKLRGGLQDIADQLCIERVGSQHQAGSDSLLTARTFFKLKEKFFGENWDKLSGDLEGHMYGLGFTLMSEKLFPGFSSPIPTPVSANREGSRGPPEQTSTPPALNPPRTSKLLNFVNPATLKDAIG